MKTSRLFLLLTVIVSAQLNYAQIVSAADGGWNQSATWVGGVVPGAADNVVINHTVTLDVPNAACNDVTINDKLRFAIDGTVSGINSKWQRFNKFGWFYSGRIVKSCQLLS